MPSGRVKESEVDYRSEVRIVRRKPSKGILIGRGVSKNGAIESGVECPVQFSLFSFSLIGASPTLNFVKLIIPIRIPGLEYKYRV